VRGRDDRRCRHVHPTRLAPRGKRPARLAAMQSAVAGLQATGTS